MKIRRKWKDIQDNNPNMWAFIKNAKKNDAGDILECDLLDMGE